MSESNTGYEAGAEVLASVGAHQGEWGIVEGTFGNGEFLQFRVRFPDGDVTSFSPNEIRSHADLNAVPEE